MESLTYRRIKELCEQKSINISYLENKLGFGNGTIQRWKTGQPLSEKLSLIADYFGVSVDYLLGRTDVPNVNRESEIDPDIVTLRRAYENMIPENRKQAVNILRAAFEYAFKEGEGNEKEA